MTASATIQDGETISILLLEDWGQIRRAMRHLILESEPRARVTEVASYDAAIEALETWPFDVAFLDVDLRGEKTGLDLLHWIRERDLRTRVIMLSGDASESLVVACLKAGASSYICKDLDGDGLFRRALDAVLQGSVFLPAGVLGRGEVPASSARPAIATAEALGLTPRAFEALYYLSQGLPAKTIARAMRIEEGTVRKDHMPKIFMALKVRSAREALAELARRSLVIPPPQGTAAPAPRAVVRA